MGENTLRLSDLERIGGQIPGGFFVYRAEEPLEMLYINDNVLHIFGCDTPEEFRELTGNTFRGMVYADDFAAIQSSIDEQIADSANEIRSGLLAGISHDIRSPMRTIAEYLRHLKSHVYDPAKLRGDLENTGAAAQRMERLVDNLLDMSTAEFGRADIHPEPCRLSEQVRYATGLFRARAGSKSQTLTESIDLPEEEVLADVQRLRTVLCNLISNAVSFTPDGGSVKVIARRKQVSDAGYAQFEFTVTDTGAGMSEDFLRRAQEALDSGENVSRADGSGVGHGLSIAQKLLRTMGAP